MNFYFFDLETSGFSHSYDRIMQFAGQRTDMDLMPIGQPDNILIKMTPDVLPQPEAVLVHGITPRKTISEGMSEAEFCKYLTSRVFTPDTIATGFNNIRFDNKFIQFTMWRNFTDAYEWSWQNSRSTWDILDLVRMTRALRPEGIKWPFAPDGKPTNSLEYLSILNNLSRGDAHDALGDANASIALAKLVKSKQPKLFDYLLAHRGKNKVRPIVASGQPIVYTSGRYPSEFEKTAVVVMATENETKSGALVYDLRIDPDEFKDLPVAELAKRWASRGPDAAYFPVKLLSYNKCPAIAPIDVLKLNDGYERLKLHPEMVKSHQGKLRKADGFGDKLLEALEIMWPKRQPELVADVQNVDTQLYDNFVQNYDKIKMSTVRAAEPEQLLKLGLDFKDERLKLLLPLYKARNYPKKLAAQEQQDWEDFRRAKLIKSGQAASFFKNLDEISKTHRLDSKKQYLLKELKLYAQSILPHT